MSYTQIHKKMFHTIRYISLSLIIALLLLISGCDTLENTTPSPKVPELPNIQPSTIEMMNGDTLFYSPFDTLRLQEGVTISAQKPEHGILFYSKAKKAFAYVPEQGFVGVDTLRFSAHYQANNLKTYKIGVQINPRCLVEIRPDYYNALTFDSTWVIPVINNDVICRNSIDRVTGYSNNTQLIVSGDAGGNLIIKNRKPKNGTDTVYYTVFAGGRSLGSSYVIITRNECDSYFKPRDDNFTIPQNGQATIPYSVLLANDLSCENYLDTVLSVNVGIGASPVTIFNNTFRKEIAIAARNSGIARFTYTTRSRSGQVSKTANLTITVR